jgi:hypothetical protein
MGKSSPKKAKPSAKAAASSTKTSAKTASAKGSGASKYTRVDLDRVSSMLSALPAIDDTSRGAFRAQCSDEKARALGATTRAATVEVEALGMARGAYAFVLGSKSRLVRYAPARLAWLLECIGELARVRDADVSERQKAAASRSGRSLAKESAQRTLGDLSLALQDVSEGRDDLTASLAAARAAVTPASDTAATLTAFADLLDAWRTKGDAQTRALLAGAHLDADDVTRARADAAALRREQDDAQGRGSALFDSAAVNTHEGRVLFELRYLRRVFHRASDRTGDPEIPRFKVSPGLQRVFAASADEGAAPAKPEEPTKPA